MNSPVIQTQDLCLQYKNKIALDHLTLNIERGGIHAIIGANGAGKSSLFRVLLGFETPSTGDAQLLGCPSGKLTPDVRGRVGFVNEEHTLPGWMRVGELAAMQRRQHARWDDVLHQDVAHNFNVQADQKIAQLSRGERAGINLALTLAQRPELLILDEPTLGLDVVAKRAFLEALTHASYDDGTTIVYCSHQMEEIERVADKLVILERGRLRHQSDPAEFCARVQMWVAAFPFKAPDTRALPGVLEVRGIDGMTHITVFDQDERFGAQLKLLGARSVQAMPVSLDRAVNGYLARGHISATPRAA